MTDDYETPPLPWAGDPDRTCPHCGFEEDTEQLLQANHDPDSACAKQDGTCTAMALSRAQVMDHIGLVHDSRAALATARLLGRPTRTAKGRLDHAAATLRRSVTRARNAWPNPTWLTEALMQLGDDD